MVTYIGHYRVKLIYTKILFKMMEECHLHWLAPTQALEHIATQANNNAHETKRLCVITRVVIVQFTLLMSS